MFVVLKGRFWRLSPPLFLIEHIVRFRIMPRAQVVIVGGVARSGRLRCSGAASGPNGFVLSGRKRGSSGAKLSLSFPSSARLALVLDSLQYYLCLIVSLVQGP